MNSQLASKQFFSLTASECRVRAEAELLWLLSSGNALWGCILIKATERIQKLHLLRRRRRVAPHGRVASVYSLCSCTRICIMHTHTELEKNASPGTKRSRPQLPYTHSVLVLVNITVRLAESKAGRPLVWCVVCRKVSLTANENRRRWMLLLPARSLAT
jgi:hypothetical protein